MKNSDEIELIIEKRSTSERIISNETYARKWAEKAWIWVINIAGGAILIAVLKLIFNI